MEHLADELSPWYKIAYTCLNIIKVFSLTKTESKNYKMDLLQMIMTSDSSDCKKLSVTIESPRLALRNGTRRVRDTVPAIITFDNTTRRLENAHMRWKSMRITANF